MAPRPIHLLTDYRGFFYSSVRHSHASMDLDELCGHFESFGYQPHVTKFSAVDFAGEQFESIPVLYQSTEDRNLFYHDYIEDVLLGLMLAGARLVPRFELFRAHHNKVFMEILRTLQPSELANSIRSSTFGTLEEYMDSGLADSELSVLKPAQGAKGTGVSLGTTASARKKIASRLSNSFNIVDFAKEWVKCRIRPYHSKRSLHRRKFIAQSLVPDLKCDYKIVVYGKRFYVLERAVRAGDFRASGSGAFEWIDQPSRGLLDYAAQIFKQFDAPFMSLDVGFDGERHHLFEFQFVHFGNTAVERASHHFVHNDNDWQRIEGTPSLGRVFAESVDQYLRKTSMTCKGIGE